MTLPRLWPGSDSRSVHIFWVRTRGTRGSTERFWFIKTSVKKNKSGSWVSRSVHNEATLWFPRAPSSNCGRVAYFLCLRRMPRELSKTLCFFKILLSIKCEFFSFPPVKLVRSNPLVFSRKNLFWRNRSWKLYQHN